jgi:hypothetical protein
MVDDFEDGDIADWTSYGGEWQVSDGELTVSGESEAKIIKNGANFSDFTYEADVTVGASGTAGLIFRVQTLDNGYFTGYYAGIDGVNDKVFLQSKDWDETALITNVLGETSTLIQSGTKYRLKIEAEGDVIRVHVNNSLKISVKDSLSGFGLTGLYVASEIGQPLEGMFFDNMLYEGGKQKLKFLIGHNIINSWGCTVALSGNYALVGVPNDDTNGSGAGAAYLLELKEGSWQEKKKFLASDGEELDLFGYSVALTKNYALVGAMGKDDVQGVNAGAAYLYNLLDGNWTEKKLVASDGDNIDQFGYSVALSEKYVLIGAASKGDYKGAVYLYNLLDGNWTEKKILASDGAAGDWFGDSVALSEKYALVGALHNSNSNGTLAGAVYLYNLLDGNWTEKKILARDGATGDCFGSSVAL